MTTDNPKLCTASIREVSHLLRSRKLSPVELVEEHLRRIEALNSRLKAFITVTADAALAQARQAEQEITIGHIRGPLHGIPVSLKDLFYTQGVRTTAGSKILSGFVPSYDSTVWARLRDAGAVLLGKCNTHEFALGGTSNNPHHGAVRNPWDLERIPGGSSGGSAAAVAAGLSMASIGTDTGGSVRMPAALCGVVGLKPTYGLVSRHGVFPLSWSLDHCGPLARTVEDVALVLRVIAGFDPADPSSAHVKIPSYARVLSDNISNLRVGLPKELFFEGLHPDVSGAVKQATKTFETLGVRFVEVSLPTVAQSHLAGMIISRVEAVSVHEKWLRERPQDYGEDIRATLEKWPLCPAVDYVNAQRARRIITEEFLAAFRQCDVILAPTCQAPAPNEREYQAAMVNNPDSVAFELARLTRPANLSGLPSVSVPCGFSSGTVPVAFQLIGPPFSEKLILNVAHAYQSATDWHLRHPAL